MLNIASAPPAAAGFPIHSSALLRSAFTPRPLSYSSPRFSWAPASPLSAAFWYHAAAWAKSAVTPRPCS